MSASECEIVNGGANGVVRAADGAFELSWANGASRVTWNNDQGLYNGNVTASVNGMLVLFEGTTGGATIAGSATCT